MADICSHCGSPLQPGARFCDVCGQPVTSQDAISYLGPDAHPAPEPAVPPYEPPPPTFEEAQSAAPEIAANPQPVNQPTAPQYPYPAAAAPRSSSGTCLKIALIVIAIAAAAGICLGAIAVGIWFLSQQIR